MEAALGFYRDLLGLDVVVHLVEEGDYIDRLNGVAGARLDVYKLAAGEDDFVVELIEVTSHPEAPERRVFEAIGASHVAFQVSEIDSLYRRLDAAGVSTVSAPQTSPYDPVKTMFCRDPDGTLVQFVEFLGEHASYTGLLKDGVTGRSS